MTERSHSKNKDQIEIFYKNAFQIYKSITRQNGDKSNEKLLKKRRKEYYLKNNQKIYERDKKFYVRNNKKEKIIKN